MARLAPPAPHLRRLLAFVLDVVIVVSATVVSSILVFIVVIVVGVAVAVVGGDAAADRFIDAVVVPALALLVLALPLGYGGLFEGAAGGTLGKIALGLRVTTVDGRPIGFGRALARTLAKTLSALPLLVGFATVLATKRRRALHDFVAGTVVVHAHQD